MPKRGGWCSCTFPQTVKVARNLKYPMVCINCGLFRFNPKNGAKEICPKCHKLVKGKRCDICNIKPISSRGAKSSTAKYCRTCGKVDDWQKKCPKCHKHVWSLKTWQYRNVNLGMFV